MDVRADLEVVDVGAAVLLLPTFTPPGDDVDAVLWCELAAVLPALCVGDEEAVAPAKTEAAAKSKMLGCHSIQYIDTGC